MAVNRFSQIQGLPEWQPQLPLELALKGLMYKQELFDKNKQLIDKAVSDTNTLADQILNPQISEVYRNQLNTFKKNLVDNFATADLSNNLVTDSIASGMNKIIDDDDFAVHIKKSKDARQALATYKQLKEKGDPNYSDANEYATQLSVMDYINSSAENAGKVSIFGYTPKVDFLKKINDGLKDIKDYSDVTAEITEHGLMFFNKQREVVSSSDIMNAIKPMLTPDVIQQMRRDANYRFKDNLDYLEQSATSTLTKRNENIDDQITSLKQNIAMNPANSRTHKINQNYIKQLQTEKENNIKELQEIRTKVYSDNKEDVDAVKFSTLYNEVMAGAVAKYGFEKTKVDIKANEGAIALMKEDRQDERDRKKLAWEKEKFKLELEMAGVGIPSPEVEVPANLDSDDFTEGAINLKLEASREQLGGARMNLAKVLESFASENGSAGMFIGTDANGRPTINEENLQAFLHGKNLYSKKTNENFNITLSNTRVKAAIKAFNDARLNVRSQEEYLERADEFAAKIDPSLSGVVTQGKKTLTVNETLQGTTSKTTYTLNQLANMYDRMGYNGFAAVYGGQVAEQVKTFHGKKYTSSFERAREKAFEDMATYTKVNAIQVSGAKVTRRDDKGMFKTSTSEQFMDYLLRIKDNQSDKDVREELENAEVDKIQYLDSYIDPKLKVTVHRVRVTSKSGDGATSGKVILVKDTPGSRYSAKPTQFQQNVGSYLIPTASGGYSTTSKVGGLPMGENGINRFGVVKDEFSTRFKPFNMQTGTYNEEIGQLLDTGNENPLFRTEDNIYQFINFADRQGKDLGKMSVREFMQFVTSYNK